MRDIAEHKEFYKLVCEPKMIDIHKDVKRLTKAVMEGNGEPSLLSRVSKLEGKGSAVPPLPPPVKTMKIGKMFSAPATQTTVQIIAALSRLVLTIGIVYISYKVTLHYGGI